MKRKDYSYETMLISAGYMPKAANFCPKTNRPLWDLKAIADLLGIDHKELMRICKELGPRFLERETNADSEDNSIYFAPDPLDEHRRQLRKERQKAERIAIKNSTKETQHDYS